MTPCVCHYIPSTNTLCRVSLRSNQQGSRIHTNGPRIFLPNLYLFSCVAEFDQKVCSNSTSSLCLIEIYPQILLCSENLLE